MYLICYLHIVAFLALVCGIILMQRFIFGNSLQKRQRKRRMSNDDESMMDEAVPPMKYQGNYFTCAELYWHVCSS